MATPRLLITPGAPQARRRRVWVALRAFGPTVLETLTLSDIVSGELWLPGRKPSSASGRTAPPTRGPRLLDLARRADGDGLDLFSLSDHPYIGDHLDAYASIGFVLGQTQRIAGLANVTSLRTRPVPVLARTVTSLSALSGGRIVLGLGAGGGWDRIGAMGVPRLSPADAVDAFEEAIALVKLLCGGGPPVTH